MTIPSQSKNQKVPINRAGYPPTSDDGDPTSYSEMLYDSDTYMIYEDGSYMIYE